MHVLGRLLGSSKLLAIDLLMSFVRSSRGAKSQFSTARIAHFLSSLYLEALGTQTTKWRREIQGHAQAIALFLRQQHGDGPQVEWPRKDILAAIDAELAARAPMAVHEKFLALQDRKKRERQAAEKPAWGGFAARPVPIEGEIDPAWIVLGAAAPAQTLPEAEADMAQLGAPARRASKTKSQATGATARLQTRRSDWLGFWHGLARQAGTPMDFTVLERQILKLDPGLKQLDSEAWWRFWQEQIDLAMRTDPRLVGLLKQAQQRRERARVLGLDWLAGTALMPTPGMPGLNPLRGQDQGAATALYRALWLEHMTAVLEAQQLQEWHALFDLNDLANTLAPERDHLLDWRGQHWLATSESLWPLGERDWTCAPGQPPHPLARELPQWAWMRVAMAMASREPKPQAMAKQFYQALSRLEIVPSETLIREAGKAQPRFLEDEAGIVLDQFESIHEAIHRAAVGTKWTGTMALDWRPVRAQGALIAGRRVSQGPVGFLRSIHSTLQAQGRQGEDKPVTVSLPLWHKDIQALLEADGLGRLKTVVSIPDSFFLRMQEDKPWFLIDPADFPEAHQQPQGYDALIAAWEKPPEQVRPIACERLWRKLLTAMQEGRAFATFEGSDQAFAPFPAQVRQVGGIDGVGALPVLAKESQGFVSWPSAAVDLSKTLDAEGNPDPGKLKATAMLAMRMLDNAITLSDPEPDSPTALFRPVCLGAIGFFEAVNRSSAQATNDPTLTTAWVSGLAEMWSWVVLGADQQLVKERGAAPAWASIPGRPFFPAQAYDRLRQARQGGMGHTPKPRLDWTRAAQIKGYRCSVRTVWAPYQGAARIAGVTPGGMGTLRPVEVLVDEQGLRRWTPTPLLLELLSQRPEEIDTLRKAMQYPTTPRHWPEQLVALSFPTAEGWERRLGHAANIRPWIDQGVSLTLPIGLPTDMLASLVKRAWWMGLSNVRFEGQPLAPDVVGHGQDAHSG